MKTPRLLLALALAAGVAACGGGVAVQPIPSSEILVLTSDFSAGGITEVRGGIWTVDAAPGLAGPDAAARSFPHPPDTVWILNREAGGARNEVVRVDLSGASPKGLSVWPTGFQSNPHDIWVEGGVAYITRYDLGSLLMLDTATGKGMGTIDLGGHPALAECSSPDGLPEMDEIFKDGDALFVTLQCLDRSDPLNWVPASTGKIAKIDILTSTLVDVIDLVGCANPHDAGQLPGGAGLVISCTGAFEGGNDGALVEFSYHDGSVNTLAMESSFNGEVMGLAVGEEDEIFIILYDSQSTFETSVARWDPVDGIQIVHAPHDGFWHNRIAVKNGSLWMAGGSAWTGSAGVMRMDLATLQIEGAAQDVGLPPQVMVWVGDPYFGGGGH